MNEVKRQEETNLKQLEATKLKLELLKLEESKLKLEETILKLEETKLQLLEKSVEFFFQEDTTKIWLPTLRQIQLSGMFGFIQNNSATIKHSPVKSFEQKQFGVVDFMYAKGGDITCRSKTCDYYASQSDIERMCICFIQDMLQACGLSDKLSVRYELKVSQLLSDIWIVKAGGIPVGAFEVKKPDPRNMTSKLLMGQVFDSMMRIRSYSGLKCVFGVITDFNAWRVCWFPDCDDAAASTDLHFSYKDLVLDESTSTKRELYVSKVYKGGGGTGAEIKELSIAIASVLLKMHKSVAGVSSANLISNNRPYVVLQKDRWVWRTGLQNATKLTLRMPRRSTKELTLLRDYGGGGDGRVWLATSHSGRLCVVKFLSSKQEVQCEVKWWAKCDIDSVFGCQFDGRLAVIMPYAFHFDKEHKLIISLSSWSCDDRIVTDSIEHQVKYLSRCQNDLMNVSFKDALLKCIEHMASKKLVHLDLEDRHVAIIPRFPRFFGEVSYVYCFIDLTRVEKVKSCQEAKENMLDSARSKFPQYDL